jgi:hypothetical protein
MAERLMYYVQSVLDCRRTFGHYSAGQNLVNERLVWSLPERLVYYFTQQLLSLGLNVWLESKNLKNTSQ